MTRRGLAALAALVAALACAQPAVAQDPVAVALAWSARHDHAATVVLARADDPVDALTSGGVQGAVGGLLLVTAGERLDPRVAAEVRRLGATDAVLLGGEHALGPQVAADLTALGVAVTRIAGGDRLATAVAAAAHVRPDATSALLVRAHGDPDDPTRQFADALGAGVAAARLAAPVLLSAGDGLSATTAAHLEASAIAEVTLVGGEAALSGQVAADLTAIGIAVERVAGPDRAGTAAALAAAASGPSVLVAGDDPDGWVSGFAVAGAVPGARLLLALGDHLPSSSAEALWRRGVDVTCGPLVADAACAAGRGAVTAAAPARPGGWIAALAGAGTGRAAVTPTAEPGVWCLTALDHDLEFPLTRIGLLDAAGREVLAAPVDGHLARTCGRVAEDVAADLTAGRGDLAVVAHSQPGGTLRGPLEPVVDVRTAVLEGAAGRGGVVAVQTAARWCVALNLDTLDAPATAAALATADGAAAAELAVGPDGGSATSCAAVAAPTAVVVDTPVGQLIGHW